MEAIWADMALTVLPSWVTDVPRNWGTTTRGKLSANNWRVICTVHLPITLIRLWGGGDAPADRKSKLDNFMDLARAVQIANLRSISKKEIELYEHYVFRYVTTFKSLYKLAKVRPIHHAALHYGDVLRGFGPAHTHGAGFYERYIHSMQSKNHNMKLGSCLVLDLIVSDPSPLCQPGEIKSTFIHSSMREANFQAMLSDDSEVRSHVSNLVEAYEAVRAEDVRGTRLAHMVNAMHLTSQQLVYDRTCLHKSSLPDPVLESFIRFLKRKHLVTVDPTSLDSLRGAVISREARFLDNFSFRGVQYSTLSHKTRNSHILFQPLQLGHASDSEAPGRPEPGQITHIFLHSLAPSRHSTTAQSGPYPLDVYLCVRPYGFLQPELSDSDQMYRRFGFAGGFLRQRELVQPTIIEPSNIISHVAVTPVHVKGYPLLHILPMDQVCLVSNLGTES